MKTKRSWWTIGITALCLVGIACSVAVAQPLQVPGLVIGLRHSINQKPCELGWVFARLEGGDRGAAKGQGFSWMMVPDSPDVDPAAWKLPPGIVFALKHSKNQPHVEITAFGRDPQTGPQSMPGFEKQFGGDLEAPKGQGYFWYETTGEGVDDAGWTQFESLPKGTIVGLKHSINQRNKKLVWKDVTYDPADASIAPPPGFKRMFGGDIGAPAHQGYFWYQKITCPCSKAEGEGLTPPCDE